MFFACTGPPANRVTLQELLEQYKLTDEQLDSEIKKCDTPVIAHYFDNVVLYSSAMELTSAQEADMKELRHVKGTQTAMMTCLQIWKQHDSSQATYRALLDIVLRLGKGDTADQICQHLTQRKYMYIVIPIRLHYFILGRWSSTIAFPSIIINMTHVIKSTQCREEIHNHDYYNKYLSRYPSNFKPC